MVSLSFIPQKEVLALGSLLKLVLGFLVVAPSSGVFVMSANTFSTD